MVWQITSQELRYEVLRQIGLGVNSTSLIAQKLKISPAKISRELTMLLSAQTISSQGTGTIAPGAPRKRFIIPKHEIGIIELSNHYVNKSKISPSPDQVFFARALCISDETTRRLLCSLPSVIETSHTSAGFGHIDSIALLQSTLKVLKILIVYKSDDAQSQSNQSLRHWEGHLKSRSKDSEVISCTTNDVSRLLDGGDIPAELKDLTKAIDDIQHILLDNEGVVTQLTRDRGM